ncbi:MAG: ATP-binding protein [bacterium]|nr:ATP-binding protein [bacterium]
MRKGQRIVLFLIVIALLLVVFRLATGSIAPTGEIPTIIFSALVMLAFVTLFLEHFFTTPTDVIASTIAILLLLSPLRSRLSEMGAWYTLFYTYNALLLATAVLALLFLDEARSSAAWKNRVSLTLKRFSTFFGNGRFLFFSLFFLTLLFYVDSQSDGFLWLFGFSAIVVLIDPKRFAMLTFSRRARHENDVGVIFGVQSKNIFLAKLYDERKPVRRFDFVEFRYEIEDDRRDFKGLIIDNYLLNEEQWVKVLTGDSISDAVGPMPTARKVKNNVVYRLETEEEPDFLKRFVGVVVEGAVIDKLRFEYGSRVPVSEGDLLELKIGSKTVLYQIVQGLTEVELLQSKNEAGVIVGEAVQLGVWNAERRTFEKFGWVPEVNTPVLLARRIEKQKINPGEVEIGEIPNTNYPVLMNVVDALAHHVAILGVTGSGKSVFARRFVRQMVDEGVKVICVDFTNEYGGKFPELSPKPIVGAEQSEALFGAIDGLNEELSKFADRRNAATIAKCEDDLRRGFFGGIKAFLESESHVALFELPDVANTTGILDYTRWFFKVLFEIAKDKKNFGERVCVVLEEAHTVVPEWNFIGIEEKRAGSLVNAIGQIALQGRKYSVGFVVVAQRTATVSKTILTQCNSIVAFQQFDNTSAEFLSNYMGGEMVKALATLKPRQAVAVGRGFRTGIPVIFQVPEITEISTGDQG